MIKTVVMPKLGTTMREGVLTDWHKTVGDYVTAGEGLLSVESNKANVEVESVTTGYLIKILCPPGETRPVNDVIGLIADNPNEDATPFLASLDEGKKKSNAAPPPILPRTGEVAGGIENSVLRDGKVKALPKARALAKKLGLDLATITGSGKDGIITVADVENTPSGSGSAEINASPLAKKIAATKGIDLTAVAGTGAHGKIMKGDLPLETRPSTAAMNEVIRPSMARDSSTGGKRIPMSPMRRVIAENMTASLARSAQACHRLSIDMTRVKEIRATYADKGTKVSFNDILVAAVAAALVEFPNVNASSDGNEILYHSSVNVGLAVALDEGLIVPNIKDAQRLSVPEIAARSRELIEKAKSGTLAPSDYKGGTFTVTNLGMFDIEDFVAIINPPEAGILAVGKIIDRVVVMDGEIVIRPMMTVCLTYDHRVLDGAPAAAFLRRVKQILEDPVSLLV